MKQSYTFHDNEKNASVVELLMRSAELYGDSIAIRGKRKKVPYEKTYNEVLKDSQKLAAHFLSHKESIHHIAVLGPSSYEWIITYFAAALAGLVIVPLDRKLSVEDLQELMQKADVDCLIYDTHESTSAEALLKALPLSSISMEEFSTLPDANTNFDVPNENDLFEIVFTSGTTGKSKGVMLTQKNIASNVWQGLGAIRVEHSKDCIFSVLPFNHAYEFTCTILGMFSKGVPICICSGVRYIQKEMQEYAPTLMFVVPLIAEKLYTKIERTAKKRKKEKAFRTVTRLNQVLYRHGMDISGIFLKEVKQALGGRLHTLMCGGAPLSEELISKFNGIGINLFQGYGLTECSPLLTVNFDYYHRPNSVGKVVRDCEVKIVDGEIWARGPSISKGYYKDDVATAESFQGDWFKTGDLGSIDKDNFVFITGRKKNLILLPNGENVSAEELEEKLSKLDFVTEVLVYAEDKSIVAEIHADAPLDEAEAKKQIDQLNRTLPNYKRIRKVKFRSLPFEKTTSAKIKRIQSATA